MNSTGNLVNLEEMERTAKEQIAEGERILEAVRTIRLKQSLSHSNPINASNGHHFKPGTIKEAVIRAIQDQSGPFQRADIVRLLTAQGIPAKDNAVRTTLLRLAKKQFISSKITGKQGKQTIYVKGTAASNGVH
jgi:hypothetical protein